MQRPGRVYTREELGWIAELRQFRWLVLETAPGSAAELSLLRDGATLHVEVPVQQLDLGLAG